MSSKTSSPQQQPTAAQCDPSGLGALSLAAAFSPPARATARPLVRANFSPIDFSTERLDTTRLNYDGTGERPQEVSDDLPEDTALRVIGPPFAFALIILIGLQVVHFK